MSIGQILDAEQSRFVAQTRTVLTAIHTAFGAWGGTPEPRATIERALATLDEPFLLVIIGEFNAGKSSLINALLGESLLEEGVTPTTSRIHWIRSKQRIGAGDGRRVDEDGVLLLHSSAPMLEHVGLVDTPGTNAIDRQHEALTEDFVPRADAVVFVTSSDRPFSESERAFLGRLERWRKKCLVVVNKSDLLETAEDRASVQRFVRDAATSLFGFEPPTFFVSARNHRRDGDEGFAELERYLHEVLDQAERVRLKLATPLQVAGQLLNEQEQADRDLRIALAEDFETLEQIERQNRVFVEDMQREFQYRLGDLDALLRDLELRGVRFFDDALRLRNIGELLQRRLVERRFQREVLGDLGHQIDDRVRDVIDWMVASEHRQWRALEEHTRERLQKHHDRVVGSVQAPLETQRDRLLESMGRAARQAVDRFDQQTEASRLAESVRKAVAGAALLEVGALGLGGIFALAAMTSAADITGVLAAGTAAALGLVVLPARRRRAKRELRASLEDLRQRLMEALRGEFEQEMGRSQRRLVEATGPYTRFVRAEAERIEERLAGVADLRAQLGELEVRLGEIAG